MTASTHHQPAGLFVGLSTLDVIQLVDRLPGVDEKVIALDVNVAAGGPATNAAVVFAALGGDSTLVSRVSFDPIGALVKADLDAHGVRLVNVGDADTTQTTVASILITQNSGERAVVSAADRGRSTASTSPSKRLDLVGDLKPDVVLVDSYEIDVSVPITQRAAAHAIPVVLDCGGKKPYTDDQLAFVSAAIVSERYLPRGPKSAMADIRSHKVPFGAVTAGGGPVAYWDDTGTIGTVEIEPVTAVDTLGAGDFFHGTLAYFVGRNGLAAESFPEALERASRVAGLSVQSFGSRDWLTRLGSLGQL